jgi:primary-amine oxidase
MALERTKQVMQQIVGKVLPKPAHPLDPLTEDEIAVAVDLVREQRSEVIFNSVTLLEPKKADLQRWLNSAGPDLPRLADVIASSKGCKVYDVVVDIHEKRIVRWDEPQGVYPSITMEDLAIVEEIIRKDPQVIEQCGIAGIPPEDMHKVYCDPWTIGCVFETMPDSRMYIDRYISDMMNAGPTDNDSNKH